MGKFNRRSFLRHYIESAVEFKHRGQDRRHRARLFDCCRGGMHLICDSFIPPGSEIVITLNDAFAGYCYAREAQECHAEVVWCRQSGMAPTSEFSLGVQFQPTASCEHCEGMA
jgi:hypothetical protein